MGFEFAGKAVYSAVWVAALALFMELLGFSTQRWVTAGGLGTVLLTLAGREVSTVIVLCYYALKMSVVFLKKKKEKGNLINLSSNFQIFTNFLSSMMIHATHPFVQNDWIQTKIQGYEVSGTVEV